MKYIPKTPEKIRAKAKRMATRLMKKLPDFLICPRCTKSKPKEAFGARVIRDSKTKMPRRVYRQSYCKLCRSPSFLRAHRLLVSVQAGSRG